MKSKYGISALLATAIVVAFAVVAHAAVQVNTSANITFSTFVPCAAGGAGEMIDMSGPLHTLLTLTINGNHVSGYGMSQPQGISGFGETTGVKYQATGETGTSFGGSLQNGQFTQTFVNNFRMIGQGPNNNLLVHETSHFTINADGTVTSFVDNVSVTCR
jgi:hypothetical protein